jgi:hypothetical protein
LGTGDDRQKLALRILRGKGAVVLDERAPFVALARDGRAPVVPVVASGLALRLTASARLELTLRLLNPIWVHPRADVGVTQACIVSSMHPGVSR